MHTKRDPNPLSIAQATKTSVHDTPRGAVIRRTWSGGAEVASIRKRETLHGRRWRTRWVVDGGKLDGRTYATKTAAVTAVRLSV